MNHNTKSPQNNIFERKSLAISADLTTLLCEIGIVLVMVGMHLGTIIRNIIPALELVNIFMLLSAVLIVCGFKFSAFNSFPHKTALFLLVIYHITMAVLAKIYDYNSAPFNVSCVAYHLFVPIFAVCLVSSRSAPINTTRLLRILFYTTGFMAIALFSMALDASGSIMNISGRLTLPHGGDPIALPRSMIVYFIAALLYKAQNVLESCLKVVFSFCAFISIMAFNTRAVYVGLLLVLVIGLIKKTQVEKATSRQQIAAFVTVFSIVILFVILYLTNDFLRIRFDEIIQTTQRGILTYFGDTSMGSDMSTSYRHEIRQTIYSDISNNFSIPSLLFGFAEYMKYYVDIPILQAFYDGGLFFGAIYFYFTFYIVAKHLFLYKGEVSQLQLLFLLFSFQYLLDQFYCGLPYNYYMWTPGVFIWVFFSKKEKELPIVAPPSKYVKNPSRSLLHK